MRIFINDILRSYKNNFEYEYKSDIKTCTMDGRQVRFIEEPIVKCSVTKKEDNLYADFYIHLNASLDCVRCLGEFDTIGDVYISGIISKDDADVDYDMIIVDGDVIDFDKILEDAIFEHISSKLHCKEDCKGLCHICGLNLNESTCNCDIDIPNIDPRLEQLKNFFGN